MSNQEIITKHKSHKRLDKLGFDPIDRLIQVYNKLEREDEFYVKTREAKKVIKLDNEGKQIRDGVRYSSVAHLGVITQMGNVANNLLRYKYARVPEDVQDTGEMPSLNITLKK